MSTQSQRALVQDRISGGMGMEEACKSHGVSDKR